MITLTRCAQGVSTSCFQTPHKHNSYPALSFSYFSFLISNPHLTPLVSSLYLYNPRRQICVLVSCCNVSPTTVQLIIMQLHNTLYKYRFHDEFEAAWSMLSYCDIWTGSSVEDDSIGCADDLDLGVVWRHTVGWHCDVWSDSLSWRWFKNMMKMTSQGLWWCCNDNVTFWYFGIVLD